MSLLLGEISFGEPLNHRRFQSVLNTGANTCCRPGAVVTLGGDSDALFAEDCEYELQIGFVGRLDNREELFSRLKLDRLDDAELVLQAILKWGPRAAAEILCGDYVLVALDSKRKSAIMIQSRFIIWPLYFFRTPTRFVFSTRISAILRLLEKGKHWSHEGFAGLVRVSMGLDLGLDQIPTPFQDLTSLGPARILKCEAGSPCKIEKYWEPRLDTLNLTDPNEQVLESLRTAVRTRMEGVARPGTFLSGGLDSSAITCLASLEARASGKLLQTFSSVLSGDDEGKDEKTWIQAVTAKERLQPNYVCPEMDLFSGVSLIHEHLELPDTRPKPYVYHALYEAARERGVSIIFEGTGGEISVSCCPSGLLSHAFLHGQFGWWGREIAAQIRELGLRRVVKTAFRNFRGRFRRWQIELIQGGMASPSMRALLLAQGGRRQQWKLSDPRESLVTNTLHLQQLIQNKSEHYGIRTLLPFLDHRLLETCLSVPAQLHLSNGLCRHLVRSSMKGLLPEIVRTRTSTLPFSPDFPKRFRHQFEDIRSELNSYGPQSRLWEIVERQPLLANLELDFQSNWDQNSALSSVATQLCSVVSLSRYLDWFERGAGSFSG